MKILFLHRNFPAQFRHLAAYLSKDPNNEVVYITNRKEHSMPNVKKLVYGLKREVPKEAHRYLRFYEESIIHAQGAAEAALHLKSQGFEPDIIYGHSWGPNMFMKDIFPDSKLLVYFEWFYNAHGSDVDFVNPQSVDINTEANIRVKNSHILVDLYSCDHGTSPTKWQHSQFPKDFSDKITVLHDGIDTDLAVPNPGAKLVLPQLELDLSDVDEIITYVGRGMEPYRGFPQFMETVKILQEKRPNAHVVIVGEDRVCYGAQLPEGQTFKKLMLEKLDLDMSRVHFTGPLPYDDYIKVLQASSAHVYLTYPFIFSWSALEAMSAGCAFIASDTAPVREFVQDGVNGFLTDFFSPGKIADKIIEVLDAPKDEIDKIRRNARKTAVENYALKDLMPKQIKLFEQLIRGEKPEI